VILVLRNQKDIKMKGKNKMKRLAVRDWKIQNYERALELVDTISTICETHTDFVHTKKMLNDFVIEVLCIELKEILENLKIKI